MINATAILMFIEYIYIHIYISYIIICAVCYRVALGLLIKLLCSMNNTLSLCTICI